MKRCVKTPKFAWPVLPASAIDPIKKFPANLESILIVVLRCSTSGTQHSQDAAHEGITQAVGLER